MRNQELPQMIILGLLKITNDAPIKINPFH